MLLTLLVGLAYILPIMPFTRRFSRWNYVEAETKWNNATPRRRNAARQYPSLSSLTEPSNDTAFLKGLGFGLVWPFLVSIWISYYVVHYLAIWATKPTKTEVKKKKLVNLHIEVDDLERDLKVGKYAVDKTE